MTEHTDHDPVAYAREHVTSPGAHALLDEVERGRARRESSGQQRWVDDLECSQQECEHWESKTASYRGHCSHASCPNYMEACPKHRTRS